MRLFAACCLLVFSAFTAHADSFVITGGSATAGTPVAGSMQWSVTAPGFSAGAHTYSSSTFLSPYAVYPGGLVALSVRDGALNYTDFLGGGFTINGVSYGIANFGVFGVFFTTPEVMAPLTGSLITLTAPFTFSAQLHSGRWENIEIPRVTANMTGSGIATVNMVLNGYGYYQRQGPATYTFTNPQPIPEPASVLLLCSGIVGLALKLRSRRV